MIVYILGVSTPGGFEAMHATLEHQEAHEWLRKDFGEWGMAVYGMYDCNEENQINRSQKPSQFSL